jgi:hypothetical protein
VRTCRNPISESPAHDLSHFEKQDERSRPVEDPPALSYASGTIGTYRIIKPTGTLCYPEHRSMIPSGRLRVLHPMDHAEIDGLSARKPRARATERCRMAVHRGSGRERRFFHPAGDSLIEIPPAPGANARQPWQSIDSSQCGGILRPHPARAFNACQVRYDAFQKQAYRIICSI